MGVCVWWWSRSLGTQRLGATSPRGGLRAWRAAGSARARLSISQLIGLMRSHLLTPNSGELCPQRFFLGPGQVCT